MIIDFSIQNYRSLKDKVTISFEPENSDRLEDFYIIEPVSGLKLLKLGIIYGPNGSGKTTILKALDFLRDLVINSATQKQRLLNLEPFLFDIDSRNSPTLFTLNFVAEGKKYLYEVSVNKHAITSESLYFYSPKKALVFERGTDVFKQLAIIKFGSKIKLRKAEEDTLVTNTLWNATVLGSFLRTNIDSIELQNVTDWFFYTLNDLVTPETDLFRDTSIQLSQSTKSKQNVLSFMKKAGFGITDIGVEEKDVDDNVKEWLVVINQQLKKGGAGLDLDTIKSAMDFDIKFEHSIKKDNEITSFALSYEDESQGTKRYFQFSGLLHDMLTSTKVVFIDELESSLHPDLVKHFLLLFLVNSKSSQLIATTHYRELLMEKDMLRDDAIWFTEKKPDGGVDLYSLSDFDSSVIRDTSSIFNAYKSGKLGAVPALSDYYINLNNGENE
ncbi:AAA family ATPase [Chitinophaga caseinilytica]|uniref:AAA family ATPase n=1 Tax=Chitinophaga caseinilytica TaxID=2267521 RepID=UPI003C2B4F79